MVSHALEKEAISQNLVRQSEMGPCVMTTLRTKQPRQHDDAHRKFIASLPCIICGDDTSTEAAHIRFADATVDKRATGMGEKADDAFTLPLCGECHRNQHGMGERGFWALRVGDPIRIALALYRVSGDHEAGMRIINAVRHPF